VSGFACSGDRFAAGERGLSLIETMFALAISVIVVGGGYQVLYNSQQAQTINEQAVQAQQSVRMAMELISADLKDAGFNAQTLETDYPSGIGTGGAAGTCGVNGVLPQDNNPGGNDRGPDAVSFIVPVNMSTLRTAILGTAPTADVVLQAGAVGMAQTDGFGSAGTAYALPNPIISLGGYYIDSVAALNPATDTLTLGKQVTLPKEAAIPVGMQVYWLKCVMYKIIHPSSSATTEQPLCGGTLPCLVRGTPPCLTTQSGPACVPVVEGIEDLQLSYACDGCLTAFNNGIPDGTMDDQVGGGSNVFDDPDFVSNSGWNTKPFVPNSIRMVKVSVVARQMGTALGSESAAQGARANFTPSPLIVHDHNHADGVFAANDLNTAVALTTYMKQQRRQLTRIVQLKNMGLF
jgi:type IV pilus assembly protein PilW